ncbi:noncompact myelin-associated protein [Corythoichthys intestinalis]|uniref:noncompact myelin-associated protein n=1 Tax=Corythoichthys intestinalis TaxID=161448 RepID=UPI0025A5252A|nr:noncompact myelin-associated protein [Corythoichthys intestinalis]
MLKMQTSTASAENTTSPSSITKSRDQILIQSSGAMIAVIVIGIIIILTILLFILKTYNKRTHTSRLLGSGGAAKPAKKTPQSAVPTVPMTPVGVNSVSGGVPCSNPGSSEWPRTEVSSVDGTTHEFNTTNGSTTATIHLTSGNT